MWDILLFPLLACLILVGIHCYLGIHVVSRGVIFVDLALAQLAALGAATAVLMGHDIMSLTTYFISLGFTFVGAGLFALGRFREERVPQEAVIGITYAVCSAVAILLLEKSPHGQDEIKSMLVGSILYVTKQDVIKTFLLYVAVGVLHWFCRKPFARLSTDPVGARAAGMNIRAWDFLFYMSFGLVVTSSVRMAGVLQVFSYLVVPAACAMLFLRRLGSRLVLGWILGALGSIAGVFFSVKWDLPTGAAIVAVLGLLFLISAILHGLTLKAIHPA